MGYSCNAAASLTLEALFAELEADKVMTSGNGWTHGLAEYFFEQGRENSDGAITGTIYHVFQSGPYKGRCKKVGSARIEGNGRITRFPCIPQDYKKRAEAIGAARFIERYGKAQADFEGILR